MSSSSAWEYALGGGTAGALGFEGQQNLILEFRRTGGNTALGGHTQGLMHTRTQGKSSDFIEAWTIPTC